MVPTSEAATRAQKSNVVHDDRVRAVDSEKRWPELPTLGPRAIGPFAICAVCAPIGDAGGGTWTYFGSLPLCATHARDLAANTPAAQAAFRRYAERGA